MLKLSRVCVPFGLDCNISCQYCYRDIKRDLLPEKLNDLMREYLSFISPEWCMALVASGGEPLLYWNKIKEVFEIANKNMHKKVMTNGLLLNDEIVNYCNDNNVEVHVSHDGERTKELRGIDVLEIPKQKELIKKINILRVVGVVTNKNCDIIANYRDTIKKLDGRENIIYDPCVIMDTPKNKHLIDGFDYNIYRKSRIEYIRRYKMNTPFYSKTGNKEYPATYGLNVDLNGNVINMETMTKYGTVLDSIEKIMETAEKSGDGDYCNSKTDCPLRGKCCGMKSQASDHMCKIIMTNKTINDYFSI